MKRIINLLCITFICIGLVGCGSKPDESHIENDLETSLYLFNSNIKLNDFEVVDTVTEGNKRIMTINVKASNKYADYELIADAQYEKNEDWNVTNIDWRTDSCTVTNHPTVEDMNIVFPTFHSEKIVYDEEVEVVSSDRIRFYGDLSYEEEGMKKTGRLYAEWAYSVSEGYWDVEDEGIDIYKATVSENIVGKYKMDSVFITSYFEDGKTLEVTKQTDNSIDIYLPSNDNSIHLEYYGTKDDQQMGLGYYQTSIYEGEDSDGKEVEAIFIWKDNCIQGVFSTDGDSCSVIFK